MLFPDLVNMVPQDGNLPDCAVVAVAMFCGVTYGEALAAFPNPQSVMKRGASIGEVQAAIKTLGITTKLRSRFNLKKDTGILYVGGKTNHVALLWQGRIIDGNWQCWMSPQTYLGANEYTAKTLIVPVDR